MVWEKGKLVVVVMIRLSHVTESKNLLSHYQRNTMDLVLCLENEIRKTQVSKEAAVGVLDMLCKEGILMKLELKENV